ncbi:GTP pyrophosphokinase [Sharpea azabuensis]|uniref:GTP pyrophosphokinase n=1 Tax=Sharpea azabuensis TaxID=322505 RepID=UPI003CFCDDBF
MSIYGEYLPALKEVMERIVGRIESFNEAYQKERGGPLYEHLNYRIKSEESMLEKLERKHLEATTYNALVTLKDAIGLRIVTTFVDDVFEVVRLIKGLEFVNVIEEKDYISHAKENGYRSYHMIIQVTSHQKDVLGHQPGSFYVEIQIRTIAMDSWAALEHQMSYKKNIKNRELISSELKRVADELASCDLSMQTIRDLINRS